MSEIEIQEALASAPIFEPKPELEVLSMADVEMRPINWLWRDYIACGKITVFAGNPGTGKSQLTAAMAAIITKPLYWPRSGTKAEVGNVIILSAEDDPADTIKPRLIAAGADLSRCFVLRAVNCVTGRGEPTQRGLDLSMDIERLGRKIEEIGNVRLLVIDPISAYQGQIDSNNNSEVRGLLLPLTKMAEQYGVAVIVITHLNKSEKQDAIARVIGSVGLVAASRAAFAIEKDRKNPDIRYFVPIKSNIGNDKEGFAYEIEQVELQGGIVTSKIIWRPELVNAQDVLYPSKEDKPTASSEAATFLKNLLSNGPMGKKEIDDHAAGAGITASALQRAKQKLGIIHHKQGMTGGWVWRMPTKAEGTEDAEGSAVLQTGTSLEDSR